ncbi:MAG: 5'-3' exonuclease H3TH domain-containing protein, partial [Thiohalocapsa sp.]
MPDRYPLVLVDASGYLFRAYHALPKLTNSRGEATGALVGVLNMLRKLIDEEKPEYIGVVFDASGPTFRDRIYEDYKANRPPMPEDLREQLGPLKEIIRAMGLPLLEVADVEADDVIGTLANRAAADGLPTLVSTGDKDMAQLVNEHITLVNTMSDTVLDPAGVKEKFGVAPEHIVDYLALMGDSIDNIPGVPKCGPKTAAKWIQEYGDLDGVLANAEKVKGKIGESLRASLEQLPLSRELTTIKTDVELDFAPTDLTPSPPDTETLRDWYERIESKRLLATLNDADGEAAENKPQPAYALVLQETELDAWLAKLEAADLFAFDTETTDLDYMRARVVGVSFAVDTDGAVEAAYVPLAHAYPGAPDQLDRERVLGRLKPLLEDPARPKVGQNLKYDMSVCANHGIAMSGIAHDTMLESYVLDSTATRHDMDSLAKKYLDRDTVHFEDIAGKGAKQLTFDQIPLEQAGHYAAEDADITLALHRELWPKIEAMPSIASVYQDIELPLVPVLSAMERTGVHIDADELR